MTNNIYKELLNTLVKSGYLVSKDVKLNVGKFNRVYDVYNISEKGKRQLDSCTPVILPVPATIKEYIKQENDKKLAIHADLERAGIDISLIPQCIM